MLRGSLLAVLLVVWCSSFTRAQKLTVEEFRVRVITKDGQHIRGVLDDVTDKSVYIDYVQGASNHRMEEVLLADIRKVVLRSNRRKTLEGAIVGGSLLAFLSIDSSHKNGFRSPVLLGLNVLLATGVGAAAGALVGKAIGPISRQTIRPVGNTADDAEESLRRQLEPFTLTNQSNILNRVPQ